MSNLRLVADKISDLIPPLILEDQGVYAIPVDEAKLLSTQFEPLGKIVIEGVACYKYKGRLYEFTSPKRIADAYLAGGKLGVRNYLLKWHKHRPAALSMMIDLLP